MLAITADANRGLYTMSDSKNYLNKPESSNFFVTLQDETIMKNKSKNTVEMDTLLLHARDSGAGTLRSPSNDETTINMQR